MSASASIAPVLLGGISGAVVTGIGAFIASRLQISNASKLEKAAASEEWRRTLRFAMADFYAFGLTETRDAAAAKKAGSILLLLMNAYDTEFERACAIVRTQMQKEALQADIPEGLASEFECICRRMVAREWERHKALLAGKKIKL